MATEQLTVTLIGGPLDGATVPWTDDHVDIAFPHAASYVWYPLCTDRRHALYWPLIHPPGQRPEENDAA